MTTPTQLRIAQPITLKCGLTLPNRLIKAAMAENQGVEHNLPNEPLENVYKAWARGGWGLVITGNVQVDDVYLGAPGDMTFDTSLSPATVAAAFSNWAASCAGAPTVVQLNHPGRQSPIGAGKHGFMTKSVAPSAVPMDMGSGLIARALNRLIFGTPREITVAEIQGVIDNFVRAARVCAEAGFQGVQIHAAHGYLLAQFLSSKVNQRTDAYGGTPEKGAKIVVDIIKAVRAATPKGFCVGIKLNSVDHQSPSELQDCIKQLRLITDAGVDFLEVSGGSYEDPSFTGDGTKSTRTRAREAFFLEFATAIRSEFPGVPLAVTGGFRSRQGLEAAVASGDCDLVGLGRPAIINPALPSNTVLNPEIKDQDATLYVKTVPMPWFVKAIGAKFVGAGVENTWYSARIKEMSKVAS
ncbi:NADH:flavin oxidoreductase/NADH oxidase [Bombardia bombarda]|uniref:NADH:flavin oxidoreductase/NADH oxidase n=1 Tax=Bombardia bombarda TaxID=252184 RepID=A0AA39XLU3_9PEZI|nr:NADH:flavin oxidoreductase/NADH oxidase [Bombardia bombarda]